MGGYGSGGWNASGRPTIADVPRVDVNRLNRAGALQADHSGTWRWTLERGSVLLHFEVGADNIALWNVIPEACPSEEIGIVWENCRFGGRRR